jgi:hypothetical protein
VSNENGVAQRLNGKLHRVFLGLLFAVVVLNGFRPMLENVDLGWHIAQGRWMVHHLAVYRADAFNYPNLGRPVIDEYPVFQVVLYVAACLGWWGPCLFAALCYAFLLGVLVAAARSLGLIASATFALSLGLLLLYLQVAFPLRPHLATYLGIAIFGTFLLRHREAGTWIHFWPLALVQVVWTNCHSGFVIGPPLVAIFGMEMIVRRWQRSRLFPWTAVRTWSGATALVFLGCFVNPYGVERFYPPFYQDRLESIRAYVGEMQPLNPGSAAVYNHLTLYAVILVALAVLLRRGAVSVSFVFVALFFYVEALSVKKSWPVFGLFLPLLVLSTAAFARITITRRKWIAWLGVGGHIAVMVPLVMALMTRLDGHSDGSLRVLWQDFDRGRTELPVTATAWMKAHGLTGRIFHRCEDGGWLQQEGFTETFADTGFGKYDEALIHETGLVADRPALLARYLPAYRPGFVLCDGFAFRWPAYLEKDGWRMIFYSPNSSVWALPGTRPDLPTLEAAQVQAVFDSDMDRFGRPRNLLLYGRDLIALHSVGYSDFVAARMAALPADLHREGWYWEAARIICFDFPEAPETIRERFRAEAAALNIDGLTAEFRAYDAYAEHRVAEAQGILSAIPAGQLSDREAALLLRVEMETHGPGALELARRQSLFDLDDGEHWKDLAQLEDAAGNQATAAIAWRHAVFYQPDDREIMDGAAAFAARTSDSPLIQSLAQAGYPYGTASRR